ncbi:hypothetical protein CONCODRAFT_2026 [Conidiobolus coronatus NRRL 28638]|uniref:G-protein coupled receptors family 1 profile domain-containing protein n=1 Tax=Conidiobolus coronatus (strain ATCC 28846 / CBS 209.66 / NRRL 28638) TaxID=796925 RepID=A0A137PJ37_CONC2|nr:hypothetical protein CONCODRAFT_2026 [Conidiobolus coronatus NRRL 28638]|eukprot:KXN74951.1 hypothetical protein CONCODRAFT_2026 [Conidiobolus coronatus NRRL 28638]
MIVLLVLCAVEIEIGLSKLVLSILKLAYGKEIMDAGSTLCYYNSFEYQLIIRIELIIVAYLSVMRYLIICHKTTKSTKFWLISLSFGCLPPLSIYIYGAILHQDKPSPSYITCYAFTAPNQINFIISCIIPFLLLIPSWVITFCYISIGLKVNKQLNQMRIEATASQDTNMLKVIKLQKVKIIIQLTLVIILYNANFSPAYIAHILKFAIGYKRPPIVEAMSYLTTLLTFTLNPVLTITFQPELNHELSVLLFRFNLKIKKLFSRFFQ